jgi:RNA polymerase sigma-70 factor, ECF subfamily
LHPEDAANRSRDTDAVPCDTATLAGHDEEAVDQRSLVERARAGDHDAFAVLTATAAARLLGASRLILRDPELAHDATQNALIRAWRDLPGLRDPDRFDAWLHRLTVNACLDLWRQRRRRPVEVDLERFDRLAADDRLSGVSDRVMIDAALRGLDPATRAVVVLHYYLGLSLPECAVALGIPTGTAKSRLNRALIRMRRTMHGDSLGTIDHAAEGLPA